MWKNIPKREQPELDISIVHEKPENGSLSDGYSLKSKQ